MGVIIRQPLLQIIEDAIPAELHAEAWKVCTGKRWYFGQVSEKGGLQFWKMDLERDPVFDSVWEHVRPRCEALAGMPLRVIRQYANGHTYGISGAPHLDDVRPGYYTLLYYPMEEWNDRWDGETVFYGEAGEITRAVLPRPNRAIFFDSRIRHEGRAPSRSCSALRVTAAFKAEATLWEELRHQVLRNKALRVPGSLIPVDGP